MRIFCTGDECDAPFQEFTGLRISIDHLLLKQDYGHVFHEIRKGPLCSNHIPFLGYTCCKHLFIFGSTATRNRIFSEPAPMAVSSIIYSEMFLFLLDAVLWPALLYPFPASMHWLVPAICKKDYAFAVFLDDKPRKYTSINHNQ